MSTLAPTSPAAPLPRTGLEDPRLDPIRDKVLRGERLALDDGRLLFTTRDVWSVCELADLIRARLHGGAWRGGVAYYNINRHLNYSNICALSCKFCEFYRKKGDDGAYTRDLDYIREEARRAIDAGATEMHIVGGLQPYLPFAYYTDMLAAIRQIARDAGVDLHLKAFTAVEIVHLAKVAKVYKQSEPAEGIRWVLERLKEAGLGSLPGGGAEVFDDRVHDAAFKGKIRSDVWLDVHRVAHELGLNTNATILYGHIERIEDRLVHMDMLRRAQDQALARLGYEGPASSAPPSVPPSDPAVTGASPDSAAAEDTEPGHLGYTGAPSGAPVITLTRPGTPLPEAVAFGTPESGPRSGYFQTIIPLPFFPDGSELEHLPGPAGLENLRTLAVSRLMLDNFPHVKAFWIMQTLPMAQLMLTAGADDVDGTVVWYDITKVGGASTHQEVTVATLQKAIRDAGFVPIERDTLYRRVERDGRTWRAVSGAVG